MRIQLADKETIIDLRTYLTRDSFYKFSLLTCVNKEYLAKAIIFGMENFLVRAVNSTINSTIKDERLSKDLKFFIESKVNILLNAYLERINIIETLEAHVKLTRHRGNSICVIVEILLVFNSDENVYSHQFRITNQDDYINNAN